ncbi:MAG: hypothetical protein QGI09_09015, partial [Dehalococcoidia bacterium]|nr:hypothetical protein [Dehalococcoidia bacterium]
SCARVNEILLAVDSLPIDTASQLLKEAEYLAIHDFDWACIAMAWLDILGAKAVPNAVHCALKSAPEHRFCAGLLTGAEAWLQIAEYDPAYLKHARLWMDLAAEDMNQGPDVMDACLCARTWARFPGPESVTESEAMLKYAQELCDQTAATEGPESGLAKEGLSLLCRTRDQIRERADL